MNVRAISYGACAQMISAMARASVAGGADQLELGIEMRPKRRGRGGARAGAGRKKGPRRSDPPHRVRPQHRRWEPVHVVLRTRESVPRLRRGKVAHGLVRAAQLAAAARAVAALTHTRGRRETATRLPRRHRTVRRLPHVMAGTRRRTTQSVAASDDTLWT